jgi:hypothetical protein
MPTGIPGSKEPAICHPERTMRADGLCGKCYDKRYRETHKDLRERKWWHVRKRFGISLEEYNSRREKQRLAGDICPVCGLLLVASPAPNLDHNHMTMQIRDFLHAECNMALGLLKDDPKICRQAAEYLEKHIGD